MTTEVQDNIFFFLDENKDSDSESNIDIDELLNQISESNSNIATNSDLMVSQMINYHENYTIKDLLLICDYYGIAKELKTKKNKCNKDIIIHYLVEFESEPNNNDIVSKRQNMWFYMSELKNDKFMKKYLLW
jgi:hypothetical protein